MDDHLQYEQAQSMIQRKVSAIVIVHTDDKAVIPAIRAANPPASDYLSPK